MYPFLKLVHVFAVIVFMGNIITGLFWKFHADGTKDRSIIAHTLRGLIRSDRWFTMPGVVVITAAGFAAAVQAGLPLLRTGWIFWSIVAFTVSGLTFAFRVAPLQQQLLLLMREPVGETEVDWVAYRAKSRAWEWWGFVATLTPLVAVVLMTMKPAL